MDTQKFDCLTRSLATTGRRGVLKAVAGAALGAVGLAAVASAALGQGQSSIPCVGRGGQCVGRNPAQRDRSCCSGCCRQGVCKPKKQCN